MPEKVYSLKECMKHVDEADMRHFVAELETGYLWLSRNRQYFRGYCFFAAKRQARELHEMPSDVRNRHLIEMSLVTEAVQLACNPKKMNVAFFGNLWAHVHWNIIPRYGNDPLPEDSIWTLDRKLIESYFLSNVELEQLAADIQKALTSLAKRDRIEIKLADGKAATS
ncbi:HIT family protein [Rhizobium miluonense]|uniref:Diadenosine tetraphosphate (Ap4A) hydrolase n=1 Tax=Rhizobium miluonense TaxID=411945 RepID=A0A1C3X0F3_9HYPH|nr:HIT family protein [Rhizobium miluonense]SCB45474.1 Diadenosine tetraphosphate (Ap4A) hydrolase [Rhizobium miluonense]